MSAIVGSSSSPPKYDDLKNIITELENLIFPATKTGRENYLASSRKILDSYKGKVLKVRPLDIKYELKDKVNKSGTRRRQ